MGTVAVDFPIVEHPAAAAGEPGLGKPEKKKRRQATLAQVAQLSATLQDRTSELAWVVKQRDEAVRKLKLEQEHAVALWNKVEDERHWRNRAVLAAMLIAAVCLPAWVILVRAMALGRL